MEKKMAKLGLKGGGRHVINPKIDHGQNCHSLLQEKTRKKLLL